MHAAAALSPLLPFVFTVILGIPAILAGTNVVEVTGTECIPLLSDCCRFILVQYDDNSTHAYEARPYIYQVFEIQDEPLNERSYYVGTVDDSTAIGFSDCGKWMAKSTSGRSVMLQLSEDIRYTLMFL